MFFPFLNLTLVKHFILLFILQNFEDVCWEKNFHKQQKIQMNKTQVQVLEALFGREVICGTLHISASVLTK